MDLISKHTDHATQALIYIAAQNGLTVSTAQISAQLGLPRPFLRKILQQLQTSGILNSTKGNKGGFTLNKAPKKIMLTELIEIFQGKISLSECIFKKKICPNRGKCPLRKKILKIEDTVLEHLKGISIAQLMDG